MAASTSTSPSTTGQSLSLDASSHSSRWVKCEVTFHRTALPALSRPPPSSLGRCTLPSAVGGIPVPDWSFVEYPNINHQLEGTRDSSWAEMWRELQLSYRTLAPAQRKPVVRWRGAKSQPVFWTNAPIEYRIRRSLVGHYFANRSAELAALGLQDDVLLERGRMSWREMCTALYQLHVDGYTNAYSLKYRLACGAVILRVEGGNWVGGHIEVPVEWWEAVEPLVPGLHYIPVQANLSNLMGQLRGTTLPRSHSIAHQAAGYARRHLSPAAVDCYKLAFLEEYVHLYQRWNKVCPMPAAVGQREGCKQIKGQMYECQAKAPSASRWERTRAKPHK